MRGRALLAVLCAALMVAASSGAASGHSGGLDQSGGHHCRQRGYDSGSCAPLNSYHCHRSYCSEPGEAAEEPAARPAPPAPPPDTEPPARPVLAESAVQGSRVTLTLTAERSSGLAVESAGQVLHRATATGAPQALTFAVGDGAHTLRVTATDAAGNPSQAAVVTISVDTTPPASPTVTLRAAGPGEPDTTVEVTGERGSTLRVRALRGDGSVARDWLESHLASGSETVPLRLPNGAYSVETMLTDDAGNQSATVAQPAQVAVAVPRAPRLRVAGRRGASPVKLEVVGDAWTSATVVIEGADQPLTREVELGEGGTATLTMRLPDGAYRAQAVLSDFQGQTSEPGLLRELLVKATPPQLELLAIAEAMRTGHLAFALRAERGASILVTSADGAVEELIEATGELQELVLAASSGTHALTFTVTDAYGNVATLERLASVSASLGAGDAVLLLALVAGFGWGGRRLWRRLRGRVAPSVEEPQPAA